MDAPAFEEFDPASDCECPGCVRRGRAGAGAARSGGPLGARLAARTATRSAVHRAVVVTATASAALGAGQVVPALAAPHAPDRPGAPADSDGPETPQGGKTSLHGPGGAPADTVKLPSVTRAEIIERAKKWVTAKVPYSMTAFWSDGYRQDCSGYVSMAWKLPGNEWTGSLGQYAVKITKAELQPGDMLLFHNLANPTNGSHVVLFGGWTDATRTYYYAYEQTRPTTRKLATPYAYWSNADRYVPYRYKGVVEETGGQPTVPGKEGGTPGSPGGGTDGANPGSGTTSGSGTQGQAYPGRQAFGPGANNAHVTRLGRLLVERGAGRFYTTGPGPRWSDADRRATQAFQQAQGWRGADADGLPGPLTWSLLTTGKGKDIPAATPGTPAPTKPPTPTKPPATPPAGSPGAPPATPPAQGVPAFPGRAFFRPGADNAHVTLLGKQLVKKGYGRFYTTGPGPRWGEADRRAVEAFQRAQGWRGGAADGYPGPETWRRLFS
ncbi:peptidoglycan-binding protein [Streptomyces sp. NPDC058417]|uniref:peptidoglycan-binding protein n=1 Tax=unclassified Streptomyces TaxID=2593676 RepID=UPI00365D9888